MKQRTAFLLRYLLVSLLSVGFTVCGAILYSHTNWDMVHFGLFFGLGAAFLLGLCLLLSYFLPKDRAEDLQKTILHLNALLDERQERFAFYAIRENMPVEINDLCQRIRRLCNKIILCRYRLAAEEEQFDFILSNMKEGFLLLDFEQNILSFNKTAQKILELNGHAEHGKLMSATHNSELLTAVDKAILSNKVSTFDISTEDGSVYSLQTRLVRSEGYRKKGGVLVVLFDVTSDRNALKQRQDFFSNASHELRTPITSIMGFSEMLEGGLITDMNQAEDSIRIIHREATRMSRIIDDLLFIAKLENDGDAVTSAPVNIGEVARELRDSLLPVMQEKNIQMNISGGAFLVPFPYSHLHNLMSNLIQNAVKYNVENGTVWVRIETDDKYLHLSVRDTGIGIPPEMKSRVFERFFRVDKGRSRNIGGTGLGLAIVKHLVSLYNGTITLESELSKGSSFQLTLRYPSEASAKLIHAQRRDENQEAAAQATD